MTFYIYECWNRFILDDGAGHTLAFRSEDEAIDCAVRFAQDARALYSINYHRPQ